MKESAAVKINDTNPNQEMVTALTGEGGVLATGAMPKLGQNPQGEKALAEALTSETATKAKKTKAKKEKNETTEEMVPKTPKDEVIDQKADVLKSATDARKYAIALKHLNYSGELVADLMSYSSDMENAYEKINSYPSRIDISDQKWANLLGFIKKKMSWYKQAEASSYLPSIPQL